jgi:hypothetical protein
MNIAFITLIFIIIFIITKEQKMIEEFTEASESFIQPNETPDKLKEVRSWLI